MRRIFSAFFVEIDEAAFESARNYLLFKKTESKKRPIPSVFNCQSRKTSVFWKLQKTQYLVITY